MPRLSDAPRNKRMQAVVRLCRQTDSPEERAELFQLGLDGYALPDDELDWDHLMRCTDRHCRRCAA